jgi:hypothetical protein
MDGLGHAFRPLSKSVEMRREELHQRVSGLRETGERESRQRLDLLRDADRRRLQRSAEAMAKARPRERRIIFAVGAAVAGFLVLVILAAFFLS